MILVRDIFRLKFGRAKEVKALLKDGRRFMDQGGATSVRQLTDVTGPYYTLVLESTYENLAGWEAGMSNAQPDPAWAAWYERFKEFVESGYREIFTIVE